MDIAGTAVRVSEKQPVNWGLIGCLLGCLAFWAAVGVSILAIV